MLPRLKVSKACENCRRRKIKCDAKQPPCGPCIDREDHSCVYSREGLRRVGRPPGKSARSARASSSQSSPSQPEAPAATRPNMSQKAGGITGSTMTMANENRSAMGGEADDFETVRAKEKKSVAVDADAMTGMVGDPARSVEFFGISSAGSFLRQINSAIDNQLGQANPTSARDLDKVSPMRSSHGDLTVARRSRFKDPRDYVLPQRQMADELIQAYYDYVWAILPVHDWTVFTEGYNDIWMGGSSSTAMPEATLHCMLNMAFALGSQFSLSTEPDQRREVGQSFWERARKLFGPHTHDSASIERVQCMLLMGLYLQSTCETYECWMIIGSAIRMAQSLGLHLSDSMSRAQSPREVEIACRVWHGCVYMDRVLSMTFGRPSMIARWLPEKVQAPVPSMIDDEFLDSQSEAKAIRPDGQPCVVAFFVHTLKLYDIVNDILLEFYQSSMDTTSPETHHLVAVLQFDDRLLKWAQALPEHLQYQGVKEDERLVYERHRIVLRARYLQARIVVLRPILADYYLGRTTSRNNSAVKEGSLSQHLIFKSAELCFQAAHEMIDVLYARFDLDTVTGPVPAWWFAVLFVYTAATVLLAERLRPIEDKPGDSEMRRSEQSWNKAIDLLKAYARVGQSAERCVAALNILSSKIPNATLYNHAHAENDENQVPNDSYHGWEADSEAVINNPHVQTGDGSEMKFPFDVGDVDFDIDDMFWLNTSAADIIF